MTGLQILNLHHAFDKTPVIRGVSLNVAPGEMVCLLGPSGCGKTTLLRIAAGLEPVQQGDIFISGNHVAAGQNGIQVPPEKLGVGLMFQDFALFPHLTVRENILFGIKSVTAANEQWLINGLTGLGLDGYADRYPHVLSGGQQQRVALLRAAAPEPQIMLLDEPFSGLDVSRRNVVRKRTLDFLKTTGIATLMVTHDPDEAMFMADRILVMENGLIKQDGKPVDIYFKPADAFVSTLFGPLNTFTGTVKNGSVETVMGHFDASQHQNGDQVDVLIRPEGITLSSTNPKGTPLRVQSARSLGHASHLTLTSDTGHSSAPLEILVRMPGVYLPETGSLVYARINAGHGFVFASNRAKQTLL